MDIHAGRHLAGGDEEGPWLHLVESPLRQAVASGANARMHRVHRALREGAIERLAGEQEPVVDRADEQLVRRLADRCPGAGRRARCRARRGARPRRRAPTTTRSRKAWASSGSVARSETRPCMTRPMSVEPSTFDRGVHERQQLRAGIAQLGQLDDLLDHVENDRQRQLVLVAPAPVDRGLRDAGARRDLLDREALDAALDEQLARRPAGSPARSRSCAAARRGARSPAVLRGLGGRSPSLAIGTL